MLAVAATLALLAVFPQAASGQGDEIRIISQKVESDFPNGITFQVTAAGPDPIEEIRVFLKPVGSERSTYAYLDIEPDNEVSGQYTMPAGQGATHKPPGTVIRYSFNIRDAAGRELRTEDSEFLYMDTSLDWKAIPGDEGVLTVYYYGAFVENRARTVLETAQNTMRDMGRVLGVEPKEPIKIISYSNYRDMVRALPFAAQAVRQDLQTQGQAWPVERVLLVLSSDTTVTGITSHEFTHILVAEAAGSGYTRVPAWLNEGLAEYGNVDPTIIYDRALAYAVFTRRLKPLWYVDTFTGDPDDILIAYGQSRSVVRFLIEVHGQTKMAELMRAFHTSLSVDEAMKKVYGFDQYDLDTQWRQALGLDPLPLPEELAQQITPTPGPAAEGEAAPAPTREAEITPAAAEEATPEPLLAVDEGRRTTRSCGGPSGEMASLPLDIAMLALLAGPFLALNTRWGLGKIPFNRRVKRGLDKWRR